MKIVFVSPHLKISGGVRIIANYAHYLSLRGHDVFVVVKNNSAWRIFFYNIFQIKPKWMRGLNFKIRRIENYKEQNFPDADMLVFSDWHAAEAVKNFSDKKGEKFYLIQHDERLYHGAPEKVAETYRCFFIKIVVSSWLKDMIKKEFNSEAHLLLNPTDRNLFKPLSVDKKKSEIRILMLHHNYEWKGTKEGVEIIGDLKRKYKNIKLIMFGARKKEIGDICDEYYHNLPQHKLAELYSSCDIYLCPSWDEGSGLPSMEAMACKCALATYDNGGSRDYAFDEQTAMVAKRKNKEDLKNKLELLIQDENLRKKISANGFNHIMSMPTWKEQSVKLENIFKEILK